MKTRTIRCYPEEEGEIIDRMHLLGYNLKHRNEIDDSHEVYDGSMSLTRGNYTSSTVYTHVERNHYLSLLFEKDIIDPELDRELGKLEQSVDKDLAVLNSACSEVGMAKQFFKNEKTIMIISCVVLPIFVIGSIVAIVSSAGYQSTLWMSIGFVLICFVGLFVTGFFHFRKRKKFSAKLKELTPIIQEKNNELDDLLRQAKKYESAVRENYKKLV